MRSSSERTGLEALGDTAGECLAQRLSNAWPYLRSPVGDSYSFDWKKRQAVRHLQIWKPLHPNLSIHIFHTILYYLGLGNEKENFLSNQSFLGWQSSVIFIIFMNDLDLVQHYCEEKLDAGHPYVNVSSLCSILRICKIACNF